MLTAGLLALFAGGLGVCVALTGALRTADPAVTKALAGLTHYRLLPSGLRSSELTRPFGDRVIGPLAGRFVGLGHRFTPEAQVQRIRRRLDLAGNPVGWDADRLVGSKALAALTGLVLGLLGAPTLGLPWAYSPLTGLLVGGLGWTVPDLVLYQTAYDRSEAIRRTLPDALDLMSISVRAGLSFDAALQQVADRTPGHLAGEFSRLLQEMKLGVGRAAGLRGLGERTDLPELKSFVSAMIQADELGVAISSVLEVQAAEMRTRRRQRAEELAQKVPIKILFPLVFCIMPCLFIVVMGPAVIVMIGEFSNRGY